MNGNAHLSGPALIPAATKLPNVFALHLREVLTGEREVALYFEPIVNLAEGTVAGYEALARFPATMGPSPEVCFRKADEPGLRIALEDVLHRQTLKRRPQVPMNCFLMLNLKPDAGDRTQRAGSALVPAAGRLPRGESARAAGTGC